MSAIMSTGATRIKCIPSASSHARPAPNPVPNHTGQARRLNRRTEKTTPKDRPSEERMIMDEMARSHCNKQVGGISLGIDRPNGIRAIRSPQRSRMSSTFSFSNASLTGLLDLAGTVWRESFESAIVAELGGD